MVSEIIREGFDLILGPGTSSQMITYRRMLSLMNIALGHTDYLGYFETNTMVTKVFPGSVQMLAYFDCFSNMVWLCLLFSILTLSLLSTLSVNNRNLATFRSYIWNYTSLLEFILMIR